VPPDDEPPDDVPPDDDEPDELPPDDDPDEPPPPPESFFDDEYRSEYQPPPLSWKLVRLTRRSWVFSAPHFSHLAGAGSDTFCITSSSFPHF
jgi:hypothetical protein